MAVKFHCILTGVAVRPPGDDGAAGIDDAALLVMKLTQQQLPVRNVLERFFVVQGKNLVGNRDSLIACQTDDADCGYDIAGGYGSNGMGHDILLRKCKMQSA